MLTVTKTPPLTYKAFEKAIEKLGPAPLPAPDAPATLPGPKEGAMLTEAASVPTLTDIGYPETNTTPFKGGESVALARMEDYLSDTDWVARFEKPKGNPAALERPATTVLSPYLKFGCLSARLMHQRLLQVRSMGGKENSC